jgi:hypothetical protein
MGAFVIQSPSVGSAFVLDVSPAVRDYVRAHGGRLFIWLDDLDAAWALQKVSTSPPANDSEFDEQVVEDFKLMLQRRRCWPSGIRLLLDPWWPFQPIAVPAGGASAVPQRVCSRGRFTV